MSFGRYPLYRDSGVDWLGGVPAHWEVRALKRIADLQSGEAITSDRITDEGRYPVLGGNGRRGYTDAYTHEGTFPVIGRQGALCGNVNYGEGRFWASEHAVVATPRRDVDPRWLGEMLRAMDLGQYSVSAAQPGLSVEAVSNLCTAVPPRDEQESIAAFLAYETIKLDALVAEQQRLIALLRDKRRATVTSAIASGLDASAPLKMSEVRWLGSIPQHWRVSRSRRLFTERNEPIQSTDRQLTASQKYGMVFQDEFMAMEGQRVVQVIKGADILKHVEPNDFVISMRSFQGGIEWCGLRGCTSSAYIILMPSPEVHPPYFAHVLKSALYVQALQSTSNLVRDGQALRFANFVQVDLPVPPMGEQVQIARFIDDEVQRLEVLTSDAQMAVRLLQERRTALISAAVTGRIDVRASRATAEPVAA